jgi:hypothetical protein
MGLWVPVVMGAWGVSSRGVSLSRTRRRVRDKGEWGGGGGGAGGGLNTEGRLCATDAQVEGQRVDGAW